MFENGGENFGKPQGWEETGRRMTVVGRVETRSGRIFERKVRCVDFREGRRTLQTIVDLMGEELLDWWTVEPR